MSHELRTPLNAITLYSEMLQENAEADGRTTDAADLAKIQSASKHLLGLINGILDMSKLEAGKMDLHLESFAVKDMVNDLISTMTAIVRQNGNSLSVTVEPSAGEIRADLLKTRQILFNLLSNAAKFTNNGSVTLHVAGRQIHGIDHVEFDTGIGLSDSLQARLFRPFAQGDSSVSRKYGGITIEDECLH